MKFLKALVTFVVFLVLAGIAGLFLGSVIGQLPTVAGMW